MTSGDEPQLGGHLEDNAPMISGRGTQIIVSARGAYQAGNLEALIGHLSPEQGELLRQALVRQCLHHLEPRLANAVEDVGQFAGVVFAHQWFENPSGVDVKRAVIAAIGEAIDGGVRYHDYHEAFLEPIYVIDATDLAAAARSAVRVAAFASMLQQHYNDLTIPVQSADTARQWQIEVAWALLTDHALPQMDDLNISR